MAEIRKLKLERAQIKGQVTRTGLFLISGRDITCEQAQTRLERLQELWTLFNDQTQVETTRAKEDEQTQQVTQEEEGERIICEENFYKAMDNTHSIIAARQISVNT